MQHTRQDADGHKHQENIDIVCLQNLRCNVSDEKRISYYSIFMFVVWGSGVGGSDAIEEAGSFMGFDIAVGAVFSMRHGLSLIACQVKGFADFGGSYIVGGSHQSAVMSTERRESEVHRHGDKKCDGQQGRCSGGG